MNTTNKPTLLLALALIGATTFALGSTAEFSRFTRATLDPTTGSGESIVLTEEEESPLEETLHGVGEQEQNTDEYAFEEVAVEEETTPNEDVEVSTEGTSEDNIEETTAEEEPTEQTNEETLDEEITNEPALGSGSVLALLQELYSSARAIPEGVFGISAPQGNTQDKQQNVAEYVFRQTSSEAYKQALKKQAQERTLYQTHTLSYANLNEEQQNSSWIRREDQERIQVRKNNNTTVHITTGSGSFVEVEAERFFLPPYTNIGETDAPHVGLRAMSELRALLDLPSDIVALSLTPEGAEANTTGLGLAGTSYTLINNVWNIRYQLYYQGKPVEGAEVLLRLAKTGTIEYARSTLPNFRPFTTPVEKTVYFETAHTIIPTIFPQFDTSKDSIITTRDLFFYQNDTVLPIIEVRVRVQNPLGEWIVLINAHDGTFIKKYNTYQFGDEESEEEYIGVPHQAWLMYLANSVQDSPTYTLQTGQWIRLSSMVAAFATDVDGVFYPEHATTHIELAGPHIQVHRGTTSHTSRITRNYLEYAENLQEEIINEDTTGSGSTIESGSGSTLGSGTTVLDQLWSSAEGLDTGLMHPFYWTEQDASLAEMNVYTHITNYETYVRTILGYEGTPRDQIAIVDSSILTDAYRSCGAFFAQGSKELHFGAGGCGEQPYSYSRDMIIHEYAHALIDTLYTANYREYSFEEALLEGVADYLVASYTNDPIIGEYTLAQPRTIENTQPIITYDQYGNVETVYWSHNTYENAAIIGGILWDLRKELGTVIADKLVLDAMAQHPRSLEELRMALLRADDDDTVITNGTPNEQRILQIFAARGILDHYQESDIAAFTSLGLAPLAPQELQLHVAEYTGLYPQLHAQEGMTISARYEDHREGMTARQVEVQYATNASFSNAESVVQDTRVLTSGERTEELTLTTTTAGTYLRLRFIDHDGRKGAWSEAIKLGATTKQAFSIYDLPERDLTVLSGALETVSIQGSKNLSILTGSGVHIVSGTDLSYLGSHLLGSDLEQPYRHRASATHIIAYDKNFDNILVIERSTAQRHLYTSGDVFIKENDLWKRAIQTDVLPMGIQDLQLVTTENGSHLIITTAGGIQSYDLQTKVRTQVHISTTASFQKSTIDAHGTIYALARTVDNNQQRLYVFANAIGKEAQPMSYFYCDYTCDAPQEFQQLPNEEITQLKATNQGVMIMTSSTVAFLADPYGDEEVRSYQLATNGLITEGTSIRDAVVEGNILHILTDRELLSLDMDEQQIIAYLALEGDTRSIHTMGDIQYIDALPTPLLYAQEIPTLGQTPTTPPNEQGGETETPPTDEESSEEETEGGEGSSTTTPDDSAEQTEETSTETTTEGGATEVTSDEEKQAQELQIEEGIQLTHIQEEGKVQLSWNNDLPEEVTQYHIYRANNNHVYSNSPRIAELTRKQTSYSDTLTPESGLYRYVLYALTSEGSVRYRSNIIEVQTSSVPAAPSFVLPQQNAVVFPKPVLQFASTYVATTDSVYQIQVAKDNQFAELLIDYQSGAVHREEYGFKIGQTAGTGSYHTGTDVNALEPGIYFVRARSIASGDVQGQWSEVRQIIVDNLQVALSNTQAVSFDTAGRGESIISSGTTIISAETYVPSFSFKVFTDTPLLLSGNTDKRIQSWDGEEGFGFAFRWSADNGKTWNYRRGDSEIEWFRIPENLSYYPIGSRHTPTAITLHSELQSLDKKQFLVELMFRVKTAEGDVGQYTTNVIVAPSKDMYGLFGQ